MSSENKFPGDTHYPDIVGSTNHAFKMESTATVQVRLDVVAGVAPGLPINTQGERP
jgi:hypothetical protein